MPALQWQLADLARMAAVVARIAIATDSPGNVIKATATVTPTRTTPILTMTNQSAGIMTAAATTWPGMKIVSALTVAHLTGIIMATVVVDTMDAETTVTVTETTVIVTEMTVIVTEMTVIITEMTVIVTQMTVIVTETTVIVTETTVIVTETTVIVTEMTGIVTQMTGIVTEMTVIVTKMIVVVTEKIVIVTKITVTEMTGIANKTTNAKSPSEIATIKAAPTPSTLTSLLTGSQTVLLDALATDGGTEAILFETTYPTLHLFYL